MAKRNGSTEKPTAVKHGAVYAPFRKALESLGDWRRDVTMPNRPDVGQNFCWACVDGWKAEGHIQASGCRRYVAPEAA